MACFKTTTKELQARNYQLERLVDQLSIELNQHKREIQELHATKEKQTSEVIELHGKVSSLLGANEVLNTQLATAEQQLQRAQDVSSERQQALLRTEQKMKQYRKEKYKLLEQMEKKDKALKTAMLILDTLDPAVDSDSTSVMLDPLTGAPVPNPEAPVAWPHGSIVKPQPSSPAKGSSSAGKKASAAQPSTPPSRLSALPPAAPYRSSPLRATADVGGIRDAGRGRGDMLRASLQQARHILSQSLSYTAMAEVEVTPLREGAASTPGAGVLSSPTASTPASVHDAHYQGGRAAHVQDILPALDVAGGATRPALAWEAEHVPVDAASGVQPRKLMQSPKSVVLQVDCGDHSLGPEASMNEMM